jgi:hypothetical protein
MQIDELTLTHELKAAGDEWDAPPALQKILSRHGWKSLGTGAEAAVAMHPQKSYVLKIFNSKSNYVHFVKFVQQHSANPHVPRFSRYVRQVPGTEFSYVRMEKLLKVSEAQLLNKYANYLAEMMAMTEVTGMGMLNPGLDEKLQDQLGNWGYTPEDLLDPDQNQEIYAKLGGEPPASWAQVLTDLAEYTERTDVEAWDMHADNFMTRGNTLVIVDPFF